ncbi:unnamed protein product [Urochloa humidicola]
MRAPVATTGLPTGEARGQRRRGGRRIERERCGRLASRLGWRKIGLSADQRKKILVVFCRHRGYCAETLLTAPVDFTIIVTIQRQPPPSRVNMQKMAGFFSPPSCPLITTAACGSSTSHPHQAVPGLGRWAFLSFRTAQIEISSLAVLSSAPPSSSPIRLLCQ